MRCHGSRSFLSVVRSRRPLSAWSDRIHEDPSARHVLTRVDQLQLGWSVLAIRKKLQTGAGGNGVTLVHDQIIDGLRPSVFQETRVVRVGSDMRLPTGIV